MRDEGSALNIAREASALTPGNLGYTAGKKSRKRPLSKPVSCSCGKSTVDAGVPVVTARSLSLRLSFILAPILRNVADVPLDLRGVRMLNDPVTSRSLESKISVCHAFSVAIAGLSDEGFGWIFSGSMDDAD